MSDFTAIPCITVIAYLSAELFKAISKNKRTELIPAVCGIVGGVLGLICFLFIPDCIPGGNALSSVATGIISGFSATGVNQMYKQMSEKKSNGDT